VEEILMPRAVVKVGIDQEVPAAWDACLLFWPASFEDDFAAVVAEILALVRMRWTGDGVVVVLSPEQDSSSVALTDWYEWARGIADVIMVWWPPTARRFPDLLASGYLARVVYGVPPETTAAVQISRYAEKHAIPVSSTAEGMVSAVIEAIGSGAERSGGERDVPLTIWRSPSFQRWYSAQTSAGNTLLSARLVWAFGTPEASPTLIYWALHVRLYVRGEDRVKSNEVVLSRPDISSILLYRPATKLDETTIVLVREFRSPATTPDGNVHELPGGSGSPQLGALSQAVSEAQEELGLAIDAKRLRSHGSRQLAATVSAHHAELFAAEITEAELKELRRLASAHHGASETERTWIEITTFGEIRANRFVDWATLGMLTQVLLDSNGPPSVG
jgi:ADP-ribose pyrophosphatase YjhB (NUDIX family)